MLIAKLIQPVEKVYQGEGLTTITVTGEYLAAQVDNYTMGQLKTTFYYKIGKVTLNEENEPIKFEPVIRGNVTVDIADLENWGTDDFVALQAVAKALNIELTEDRLVFSNGVFTA